MSDWKQRINMAVLESAWRTRNGHPVERRQRDDRDGYEFELTHATTSEVAFTSDACLLSLPAPSRLLLEYLVEAITQLCLPGVTPVLAPEFERDYIRILAVRGALPVEAINAASLRWLLFALAVSRDALMDAE